MTYDTGGYGAQDGIRFDYASVGMKMKSIRRTAGISQQEMADRMYISRSKVSRLENGVAEWNLSFLYQYMNILHIDVMQLPHPSSSSDFFAIVGKKGQDSE